MKNMNSFFSSSSVPLWVFFCVAFVLAGIAVFFTIASAPPRHGEHLTWQETRMRFLPPTGADFFVYRFPRTGGVYSFAISESDFLAWTASDPRWERPVELTSTAPPYELPNAFDFLRQKDGSVPQRINDGWSAVRRPRKHDPPDFFPVEVIWNRSNGRAYYFVPMSH